MAQNENEIAALRAAHYARASELLRYNNAEVERRRRAERYNQRFVAALATLLTRRQISDVEEKLKGPGQGSEPYVIWSNEHKAWWAPARCGYTTVLGNAGQYPRAEAVEIARSARGGWLPGDNPPEIAMPLSDAIAQLSLEGFLR